MLPYGQHTITWLDTIRVAKQLRFGQLTQGKSVENFESKIAQYVGSRYAVAVSSATAALHLSQIALNLIPGSKVATSPISFVSTSNSSFYAGLTPIFVDIDPSTGNIDLNSLEALVTTQQIKCVIPVHYGGLPVNMEELSRLATLYNFFIIEDAAHALGATYKDGSKVGCCKYSDVTVFSFHPVKTITTGEGGIITTNNVDIYNRLLRLRSHGITKDIDSTEIDFFSKTNLLNNSWFYKQIDLGYHYRLTDFQSVLGSSQLQKIDKFVKTRALIANRYDEAFESNNLIQIVGDGSKKRSAHHLYSIKIDFESLNLSRNELMHRLREKGITTQVHYIPIPLQPYYQKLGYSINHIPNAMDFYLKELSIPIYPKLSINHQRYVISNVNKLIK